MRPSTCTRTASDPDNPGLGEGFHPAQPDLFGYRRFCGVAGAWFLARRAHRPISELSQRVNPSMSTTSRSDSCSQERG